MVRIGARIVKTGIAVTITMSVCKALNLEPAFFGAVSAVANMQPSIFLTVKTAKDQIIVHLLGVGAGLLFGYLAGSSPLVMGIMSILLIVIYLRFHLQTGISMGIVAAIFVMGSGQELFLPHALNRTGVVFAGLITAMLVNILLWPPRYKQQFIQKIRESNEKTVAYFCQAIITYARLENDTPDVQQNQKKIVHDLNREVRKLAGLIKREGEMLTAGSAGQRDWFVMADKLLDYNETLTEKADRIYELALERFERRKQFDYPEISPEFRGILNILEDSLSIIERVNGKLRAVILDDQEEVAEKITEDYWERLTWAIEQWQSKLTGSYFLHALIEAAVTADEIKWATRQGKRLLAESVENREHWGN